MTNKNVIILQADTVDFNAQDEATLKFMKKAVVFTHYKGGDLYELNEIGGCKTCSLEAFSVEFIKEHSICLIKVTDANKALEKINEIAGRTTLLLIVTPTYAAMEGLGINSKIGKIDREVYAKDLAPTICYIIDADLPENPLGAILYQALKEPNLKAVEMRKAEQSIASLENAIERKSRNPWDKHDCA